MHVRWLCTTHVTTPRPQWAYVASILTCIRLPSIPAHDCLEVEESVDRVVHVITMVGRHVIEDECEGYIIMYILYHLCMDIHSM